MEHITIAVIGAGTMGQGIIESAIVHGLTVHAVEEDMERSLEAERSIRQSLEKGIRRGKIDLATPEEALAHLGWYTDLEPALSDVHLVIEAIPELEELKISLFQQLDAILKEENRDDVILASNTSSISISKLGSATGRPDKVVGMHFFNPVPVMKPVEIVRGDNTSEETIQQVQAIAERMGKQALVVKDAPGFVVNRVLMPMINEAIHTLEEGVADAKTIDSLMRLGCNHPMGPLELADLIGLDVCLFILNVLYRETGDRKFAPPPLLLEKVEDGKLGRKTKNGFYAY